MDFFFFWRKTTIRSFTIYKLTIKKLFWLTVIRNNLMWERELGPLKKIHSFTTAYIIWNVITTNHSLYLLHAGDHYLRPYVISKPEVTVTKRSNNDEFLILGSDGLWDVISNEVACQIVKRCLEGRLRRKFLEVEVENESRAAEAAAVLTEVAMARGSKDNISVIVVELRKPRGFSSL